VAAFPARRHPHPLTKADGREGVGRSRIEKIFGTWKHSCGLRRMRWRGLAKAACRARVTAIAYNLKRALTIQTAA
jgi:IS5 family transposase